MKGTVPTVSVIVPTYKRAARLGRALDSIIAQTYPDFEVIVVNDNVPGSEFDAATFEVLSHYLSRDERVRVVHTQGQIGGGAARNFACKSAMGSYLAFLDDDDEFLPDKLETQLAFMQANNLDMSWQDICWYDENGKLVEHRRLNHCTDFSQAGLLRAHLLTPISPTSIYMLKRELFDKTDGFGEVPTGQDWWLMLRCIETDAIIGYMPEVHVRQYLHPGERLSLGKNKIAGEEARHEKVRSYYPILSRSDIAFIEFRHNAALAFACKGSGNIAGAAKYAVLAVKSSPVACVQEGIKFFTRGKDRA